jgi:hypothetical protein
MLLRFWNWFWNFATTMESISFVLAALGAILGLAWGKAGLRKLKTKQEARLWTWVGWLVVTKLCIMAFTVLVQVFFYFKR